VADTIHETFRGGIHKRDHYFTRQRNYHNGDSFTISELINNISWRFILLNVTFNVQWNPQLMSLDLRFFSFNIQFKWSQVNKLSLKFPPFKIFLCLVFISTAPQRNLRQGFHCIYKKFADIRKSKVHQCKNISSHWTLVSRMNQINFISTYFSAQLFA
jgi:hypothetical protein